jgi:hypothetical protein
MWKMRMRFTGSRRNAFGARVEPAVLDVEILVPVRGLRNPGSRLDSAGRRFLVLLFQRRAEDARQVAHILGDEKVGAHEMLDRAARIVVGEAHAGARQLGLHVEGKPLFRAAAI